MNNYTPGQVYEVHTPHNNGIYKVIKVVGNEVYYKSAVPYLDSYKFDISSNFSDKSVLVNNIEDLIDRIIENLNNIKIEIHNLKEQL